MRLAASALLIVLLGAPRRDIEVGVPPGTPLEWDRDLFRPATSERRGRIPVRPPAPLPSAPSRATVVHERIPEPLLVDFGSTSLYDYFRITTVDIMRHVNVLWPRRGVYDPDVPSEEPPDLVWSYPPAYATELYWAGALNTLRAILHPEVVSARELACYILEIGECGLTGSKNVRYAVGDNIDGPLPLKNYPVYHPEVPDARPPVAGGETPLEQMIHRMVVVELTNGFPYSFDPSYARYTLACGRSSLWSVIECSRSEHTFLARNAVAILALMPFDEARAELRKIVADGKDIISWMRAVMALARKRDLAIVPDLERWAEKGDEIQSTAAIHALGLVGDRKSVKTLLKIAHDTDELETLWTVLPAIARLNDDAQETRDGLRKLVNKRVKPPKKQPSGGMVPPKPEPQGTKGRIVDAMLTFARVASGEKELRAELLDRIDRVGLANIHPANGYLAIDVLALCGEPAKPLVRKLVETKDLDPAVRASALARLKPLDPLTATLAKKLALDVRLHVAVRGMALLALSELEDPALAREAADEILSDYVKRDTVAPPVQASLAAMSMQILGSTGGTKTETLIHAADKAWRDRAWAFRFTSNSNDLTKAVIYSQPPTLEVAVVELGRTLDPAAVPQLAKILRSRAGGGRAEAALALGAIGGRDALEALIAALQDPVNGWVRFNAYRALRQATGVNHFDDWMFLPPVALRPTIEKYRAWWKGAQK